MEGAKGRYKMMCSGIAYFNIFFFFVFELTPFAIEGLCAVCTGFQ